MRKFLKVFFITVFSFITLSLVNGREASAAWNNNALDFYNKYGQGTAVYLDGSYWFCSRGAKVVASLTYRTIGYEIGVRYNGTKYTFSTSIGGYIEQVGSRVESGNYNYVLYKIPYSTLTSRLVATHPNVDFSDLVNRKTNTIIYFDAYVTFADSGVPRGSIDINGNTTGAVYHDVNSKPASWISDADWQSLFFKKTLAGSDKVVPTASVTPISVYSVDDMNKFYGVGNNTFYIQPNVNITLQFIGSTSYYDKYNRIGQNFFLMKDYYANWKGTLRETISHSSSYEENFSWDGTPISTITGRWGIQQRLDYTRTLSKFNFYYNADAQYYDFYPLTRMTYNNTDTYFSEAGWWTESNKITIISDGSAPKATSNSATFNLVSDTVSLALGGVTDNVNSVINGSGVKASGIYAKIYPQSNPSNVVQISLSGSSSDFTGSYKLSNNFTTYGTYVVDFYTTDNVNNTGIACSTTFERIAPKPVSDYATIEDYEYYESSTGIKWVQANNEFRVNQKGHGEDRQPDKLWMYLQESNTDKFISYHDDSKSTETLDSYNGFAKNQDTVATPVLGESYSMVTNTFLKANSNVHGKIFTLNHSASVTISGKEYTSDIVLTTEKLGVDAKAPTGTAEKTDLDKFTVTAKDPDSGLKEVTYVTPSGNKTYTLTGKENSIVIPIVDGSTSVILKDNVGNTSTIDVSGIGITRVEASLTTSVVTENSKKRLKVTVTAKVINPMPKNIFTFNVKGTGDGVPSTGILGTFYVSDGTEVTKSYYVEDIYNTPSGPTLTYSTSDTKAGIIIGSLADITKSYSFNVEYKADSQTTWSSTSKVSTTFASGYNHYKYTLERLKDSTGADAYFLVANNVKNTSKYVDTKYLPSGKYKITVTMYDYNGNPSGKTVYEFDHIQPAIYGQLNLKVTAVKDVSWKKATYPFSYDEDTSKFPLGSAYKFNNNPIKLGYTINYNVGLVSGLSPSGYEVDYDIYGKDSSGNRVNLKLTLNGKDLSYYDSNSGTRYLKQTSGFTVSNGRLYVKHYLPASLTVTKTDGSAYTGMLYVDAKFKASLSDSGIDSLNGTYHLYSVTLSSTAFDDLELDKQR